MAIAKPTQVAAGKIDPSCIYARIANKNIYRLNTQCNPLEVAILIATIKEAGKIHLQHWTKVDKRAPRTAPLSPSKPLMGSDPIAPRFRILDEFRAKCDKLEAEGKLGALQDLYNRKADKAQALEAAFDVFQKTMHDTEADWEELDRLERLLYVVTTERDYANEAWLKGRRVQELEEEAAESAEYFRQERSELAAGIDRKAVIMKKAAAHQAVLALGAAS